MKGTKKRGRKERRITNVFTGCKCSVLLGMTGSFTDGKGEKERMRRERVKECEREEGRKERKIVWSSDFHD